MPNYPQITPVYSTPATHTTLNIEGSARRSIPLPHMPAIAQLNATYYTQRLKRTILTILVLRSVILKNMRAATSPNRWPFNYLF